MRLSFGMLDLFFPRFCLSCGRSLLAGRRRWLCVRCLARLEPIGPDPCPRCSGPLGPGASVSRCADCRRLSPDFDGTVAAGRYEGLLRDLVPRLKYGRETALAWPLGDLLAETIRLWPPAGDVEVLVPVPMPFGRRIRRGFNQADLLAREVGRILDRPVRGAALRRSPRVPAQAGLSRSQRLRAPRRSVRRRRFARSFRGRTVLLVDDVLTTGATASEVARALKADGARTVHVAVVARA